MKKMNLIYLFSQNLNHFQKYLCWCGFFWKWCRFWEKDRKKYKIQNFFFFQNLCHFKKYLCQRDVFVTLLMFWEKYWTNWILNFFFQNLCQCRFFLKWCKFWGGKLNTNILRKLHFFFQGMGSHVRIRVPNALLTVLSTPC
jgi:hypothetical protein